MSPSIDSGQASRSTPVRVSAAGYPGLVSSCVAQSGLRIYEECWLSDFDRAGLPRRLAASAFQGQRSIIGY